MGERQPKSYQIGDGVRVVALGRIGTIAESTADGRYRVRLGAIVLVCRPDELEPAPASRRHGRSRRGSGTLDDEPAAPVREGAGVLRLDLHGCTVEEALARLDEALNDALLRDLPRLEIIHGHGTGRVRQAVHRHLRSISAARRFTLDPHNPGVTWVWL